MFYFSPPRLILLQRSVVFLAVMMASLGNALAGENGDTLNLTISGVLYQSPTCTFGTNNTVFVEFGDDILTRKIDGVSYKKTKIEFKFNCTYYKSNAMKFIFSGDSANFGTGILKTSREGLGIRLYAGSTPLNIENNEVNFLYGDDLPELYAVPVAEDNTTLESGVFTGTSTLIAVYQ